MSGYLNDQQFAEIQNDISIYRIGSMNLRNLSTYSFNVGIAHEYKDFLIEKAAKLDKLGISATYIMIHNVTDELVGYFSLSTDTIKLTPNEKADAKLDDVGFMTLPAIKMGKLAINKSLSKRASRKGYGSFAIEMALSKAYEILKEGVACRFLTVDADIEYYPDTTSFYLKNGFVYNQAKRVNKSSKTISMRRDIFGD